MDLIRGIVAAPVLPMTEDFEIDWPRSSGLGRSA